MRRGPALPQTGGAAGGATLGHVPDGVAGLFSALELSPDAVFVTDRRNAIVFWNRTAERILGYRREEAVGAPCDRFLRGDDVFGNRYCAKECPVMKMAARSEPVNGFRLRLAAKDGGLLNAELGVLQLTVEPPDHYYLIHILRPIERLMAAPVPHADGTPAPRSALEAARESTDARARRLSSREVEVLGMLAAGRSTPEIAARLHIATMTARNHIQNILEKLEVHSKGEAIAFAFQKQLI